MKKVFIILAAAAMFVACGGGSQTKQGETKNDEQVENKDTTACEKKCEANAVCISKVIETPADFMAEEVAINAKIAKCDSTGNFYACDKDNKSIEIVPAEGVALAEMVDKVVSLKGKVVEEKLHVSAVCEASACCGEGKEGETACCSGEKKEDCCKDKETKAEETAGNETKEEAKS